MKRRPKGNDVVFRLSLPDDHKGGVSVAYELEHDTTDQGDLVAKAGKVRIAEGETEQFIRIPTTSDNDAEPTETFRIRLTNVVGAEVSDPVAYGTIRDDDTEPTIYVSPVSTTAGEDAEFVLNLSNPYKGGLSTDWNTQEGTAKSGEHFEARGGKLEFAPYEEYKVIRVPTANNNVNDSVGRQFSIDLGEPMAGEYARDGLRVDVNSQAAAVDAILESPPEPFVGPMPVPVNRPQARTADPDIGIIQDTNFEGEWLSIEISLLHAVVNSLFMTSSRKKHSHGGKRLGAGRKPNYENPVMVAALVPSTLRNKLDRYAKANDLSRSQAIVEAIRRLVTS